MISSRVPVFALCAIVAATPVSAQEPDPGGRCYRFDRPYFTWYYRGGAAEGVRRDSAYTLLLDSAMHTGPPYFRPEPAWRVRPTTLDPERELAARWLDASYWLPLDGDSISVAWREGFYGPVFRLQVIADTLRGSLLQTTDVYIEGHGRPSAKPASAVRVPCPD